MLFSSCALRNTDIILNQLFEVKHAGLLFMIDLKMRNLQSFEFSLIDI